MGTTWHIAGLSHCLAGRGEAVDRGRDGVELVVAEVGVAASVVVIDS